MTNAKVILPKEVAEVIEELREIGYTDAQIIHGFECGQLREPLHSYFYEGERSSDVLMPALVNGYTVEKSPEEKVREYYDRCRKNATIADHNGKSCQAEYLNAQAIGASITLDILGINIEGVNA